MVATLFFIAVGASLVFIGYMLKGFKGDTKDDTNFRDGGTKKTTK